MKEDDLANAIIQREKEAEKHFKELGDNDADLKVYPEAHYNHFGNRGVADLYLEIGGWQGRLLELKSESAVKEVTGANKIIRQFNQMREFFYQGSEHPVPTKEVIFELCFIPSEFNAQHVIENADMYASVVENDISNLGNVDVKTQICFRLPDPEDQRPILMFSERFDFREGTPGGTPFEDYAQANNPELFSLIEPAFNGL